MAINYPLPLTTSQNQNSRKLGKCLLLLVNACTTHPSTWTSASTANYHGTTTWLPSQRKPIPPLPSSDTTPATAAPDLSKPIATRHVRPTLEYASSVWDPATKRNRQTGGGAVACRQICIQLLATPEQFYQDDTTSVAVLRTAQVHGEVHYNVQDTEQPRPSRHPCHISPARTHCAPEHLTEGYRGHPFQLVLLQSRILAYQQSFFVATLAPWNSLPATVVKAPSPTGCFQFQAMPSQRCH